MSLKVVPLTADEQREIRRLYAGIGESARKKATANEECEEWDARFRARVVSLAKAHGLLHERTVQVSEDDAYLVGEPSVYSQSEGPKNKSKRRRAS